MSLGRSWKHGERRAREAWLVAALCLLPTACAGRTAKPAESPLGQEQRAEIESLRSQLAERDRRLNQLESRLSLLEASQRELRYALAEGGREHPRESITIGEREASASSSSRSTRATRTSVEPSHAEPRPVLRLYEERSSKASLTGAVEEVRTESSPSSSSRPALMPVPEVSERLPIAPVPSLNSLAHMEPAPAVDPTEQYRRAIDLVRQREFPQALRVLDDFLAQFARDPRAAKAMFWRGEVLFAQRDYAAALGSYQNALSREPRGEKAADALLKIGLCHRHLGASERAQEAMRRLRTEFPESAAARLLSEEDA